MLEYALVAGLTASGADVSLMHVTTTPSVAYITRTDGFDCGIMISASHNPYYDNGIKFFSGEGKKLANEMQDAINQELDKELKIDDTANLGKSKKLARKTAHESGELREKYT